MGEELFQYEKNKFYPFEGVRNELVTPKGENDIEIKSGIYVKDRKPGVLEDRQVAINLWQLLEQIEMYADIFMPEDTDDNEVRMERYKQFFLQCLKLSEARNKLMKLDENGTYFTLADVQEQEVSNK